VRLTKDKKSQTEAIEKKIVRIARTLKGHTGVKVGPGDSKGEGAKLRKAKKHEKVKKQVNRRSGKNGRESVGQENTRMNSGG